MQTDNIMKRKLKILRIIPSLDPKYGGPSKATIDSSMILIKQGFEVHILTTDRVEKKFLKSNKKSKTLRIHQHETSTNA